MFYLNSACECSSSDSDNDIATVSAESIFGDIDSCSEDTYVSYQTSSMSDENDSYESSFIDDNSSVSYVRTPQMMITIHLFHTEIHTLCRNFLFRKY